MVLPNFVFVRAALEVEWCNLFVVCMLNKGGNTLVKARNLVFRAEY
jgi:hypothetical protein